MEDQYYWTVICETKQATQGIVTSPKTECLKLINLLSKMPPVSISTIHIGLTNLKPRNINGKTWCYVLE